MKSRLFPVHILAKDLFGIQAFFFLLYLTVIMMKYKLMTIVVRTYNEWCLKIMVHRIRLRVVLVIMTQQSRMKVFFSNNAPGFLTGNNKSTLFGKRKFARIYNFKIYLNRIRVFFLPPFFVWKIRENIIEMLLNSIYY